MDKLKTYEDISEAVAASQNVLTVTIGELRDVNGSGRLGPYVVEAISKSLAAKGLGHTHRASTRTMEKSALVSSR